MPLFYKANILFGLIIIDWLKFNKASYYLSKIIYWHKIIYLLNPKRATPLLSYVWYNLGFN